MSDCKHTDIDVYFMHDGTPAQFWACSNCMVKFVPITNELRFERNLAAAVERAERAEAALQRIALLDPADTDEGFNEWGEAACYVEAKDIADAALAAKETPDA
jgi:hypothetical protein